MNYESASSFFKLSGSEHIVEEWVVLEDSGGVSPSEILLVIIGLCFFVVPGLLILWHVLTQPNRTGYLCLTNWRCLYLAHGKGMFKNTQEVSTIDVDDVVAVHSIFEKRLFGGSSMILRLHSRHEDSMTIEIGDSGLLRKLPILGFLFRRSSIGRDGLKVAPVLYESIVNVCEAKQNESLKLSERRQND